MYPFAKIANAASRILLAAILTVGHFVLCMCPVAAAEATIIEPIESSCCDHGEASEPESCCGGEECTRTDIDPGGQEAVVVEASTASVESSTVSDIELSPFQADMLVYGSAVSPIESPPPSVSTSLLFCVLTQ